MGTWPYLLGRVAKPPDAKQQSSVYVLVYRSLLRPRVHPIAHCNPTNPRPALFVCGKLVPRLGPPVRLIWAVVARSCGQVAQVRRCSSYAVRTESGSPKT